jgi:hypothetical protein
MCSVLYSLPYSFCCEGFWCIRAAYFSSLHNVLFVGTEYLTKNSPGLIQMPGTRGGFVESDVGIDILNAPVSPDTIP